MSSFIKSGVRLWKHQEQLVSSAINHGSYNLWFAGCGTGKTLSSIVLADRLEAKRILVLTTKAAMVSVWKNEIDKWTFNTHTVVPIGSGRFRRASLTKSYSPYTPTFYVINYEFAWRVEELLSTIPFDLVIADECHKLQSHSGRSSTILAMACRNIKYKLAMTGTLMEDKVTQVYGQVRFLDSKIYRNKPVSTIFGRYTEFRNQFEVTKTLPSRAVIVVGSKNLGRLAETIAPFTCRLDSSTVLDLPDYLDIYRYVDIDKPTLNMYEDMRKHKITETDRGTLVVDNKLTQFIRLQEIVLGHYRDGNLFADPMLEQLHSLIGEIGNKPIVIYVKFVRDVQRISDILDNKVCYLTGSVNELADWKAGKYNILIANIAAGSESVDLTRARYVIYYSKSFSRTQYIQSRYRVYRPPAKDKITYYHIVARNTIVEYIEEALAKKAKVTDYLIERLEK